MPSSRKTKRSAEPKQDPERPALTVTITHNPKDPHLSELLVAFRKSVNKSQLELAEKTGLSIATIRRYESKKYSGFTIKHLARIIRAYGYDIGVGFSAKDVVGDDPSRANEAPTES